MINILLKLKFKIIVKLTIALAIFIFIVVILFKRTGKDLVGNYEIDYIDSKENMSIYYIDSKWGGIGVINQTVFAVGHDNNFIIFKQHPNEDFKIVREITNYFIIPLKLKISASPEDNKIGPLTETEFLEKRKELRISNTLDFNTIFEELQ